MNFLTKENIILIFLGLLVLGQGLDLLKPNEGVTTEDINRIIRLKESDTKQKELEKNFKLITERDEIIQKSVNTDSIIVWDSGRKYRDSLRAITNPE